MFRRCYTRDQRGVVGPSDGGHDGLHLLRTCALGSKLADRGHLGFRIIHVIVRQPVDADQNNNPVGHRLQGRAEGCTGKQQNCEDDNAFHGFDAMDELGGLFNYNG